MKIQLNNCEKEYSVSFEIGNQEFNVKTKTIPQLHKALVAIFTEHKAEINRDEITTEHNEYERGKDVKQRMAVCGAVMTVWDNQEGEEQ
jgi:hypothetical protein